MYILLFVLWIILNGKFTAEIAMFGLVICAVVYVFTCKFMDYSPQSDMRLIKKSWKIFKYVVILIVEIIKANLATAKMILTFDKEPEPLLVRFRTNLKTGVGQTLLANSITLTPGTITVTLEEGEYLVHCLDKEFSEDMNHSVFTEKISELEESNIESVTEGGM